MSASSGCVNKMCRTRSNGDTPAPSSSVLLRNWGSRGSADGRFTSPIGLAVAADGTVVVADQGNHRIQCFRSNGDFMGKWGSKGRGDGQFQFPLGVAIGVCEGTNASLLQTINKVPEVAAFPPGIASICAAYVGEEFVYVADSGNDRIQVFNINGRYQRQWGTSGQGNGEFSIPYGCCMDHYENALYVADSCNHRIQVFRRDGTFLGKWESPATPQMARFSPTSVSASRSGLIYVADPHHHRIIHFHRDGTIVGEWSGNCTAVMVDDNDGVLYGTDRKLHCIVEYRLTPLADRSSMCFAHTLTPLVGRSSMCFAHTLTDGAVLQKIGDAGRGDGPFCHPSGLAKGSNGVLYVTDCGNARVVALQKVGRFDRPGALPRDQTTVFFVADLHCR